jgi:hypothetical protein
MSTVIADNLTGKTSAGDITVTSEGGAATMQLQQGLAKAWVRIDGTGTAAIDDSLNCGSLIDNGTGNYSVARVNNMSSADTYYVIEGQYINSQNTNGTDWSGTTTATVQYKVYDSSATDRDPVGYLLVGDLA